MPFTVNGHTYTRRYAWLPTRMDSGQLVWFEPYYITPGRNGIGILLSQDDYNLRLINSN